jgi:hypothetical protein
MVTRRAQRPRPRAARASRASSLQTGGTPRDIADFEISFYFNANNIKIELPYRRLNGSRWDVRTLLSALEHVDEPVDEGAQVPELA